jgi:hypothetical protein
MQVLQMISQNMSAEWAIGIGILVVEFLMRVFKTKEPKSLLYYLSNLLKVLADLMTKIAMILDKALQRVESENIKIDEKKQN